MSNHDIDALDQAAYETVHNFKDKNTGKKGAGGIADITGMKASSVQNKANRTEEFANFNIKEMRSLMLATNDFRMLKVMNQVCGFIAVELPSIEYPADSDLVNAHIDVVTELGEATGEMKRALNDKKLTQAELRKVKKEFHDVIEKVYGLFSVLDGMAEPEDNVTQLNRAKS